MAENKVNFGLSNVYYAILTEGDTNSWATPVKVPGAVSLTLDDSSASSPFYADNVIYYQSFANNGYTGSLEMARIPEQMLADVWGIEENATDKVIYERANVQPKPFALLFQREGDDDSELVLIYRVIPTSKPTAGSSTIEDSPTPVTQSFEFNAPPLVTGAASQLGLVKATTGSNTPAATKTAWFSAVTVPSN